MYFTKKRLVHHCSKTYNGIVSVLFLLTTSVIIVTLLEIKSVSNINAYHIFLINHYMNKHFLIFNWLFFQKGLKNDDLLILGRGSSVLIVMVFLCFLLCNLGEDVTSHYANVNDSIYQISWYLCPLELQKSFKLMIMISQKPIYLEGFARFQCNRETFNRVFFFQSLKNFSRIYLNLNNFSQIVNSAYSFFNILRRFN